MLSPVAVHILAAGSVIPRLPGVLAGRQKIPPAARQHLSIRQQRRCVLFACSDHAAGDFPPTACRRRLIQFRSGVLSGGRAAHWAKAQNEASGVKSKAD